MIEPASSTEVCATAATLFAALYQALQVGMQYNPDMRLWASQEAFVTDWLEAFKTLPTLQSTPLYRCTRGKDWLVRDAFTMIALLIDVQNRPNHGALRELFRIFQSALLTAPLSTEAEIPTKTVGEQIESSGTESPAIMQISDSSELPNSRISQFPDLPILHDPEVNPSPEIDLNQSSSIHSLGTDGGSGDEGSDDYEVGFERPMGRALKKLWRTNTSNETVHPKKECFRCQLIRTLKKSVRQLKAGKVPRTGITQVKDRYQREKWESLKTFYQFHHEDLDAIADTAAGPVTDGKNRGRDRSNDARSYNNRFCRNFFMKETIRVFYLMLVDLVYEEVLPEELCVKMKARCCKNAEHRDECIVVWKEVYNYAKSGVLEELGFKNRDECNKTFQPEDFLGQ